MNPIRPTALALLLALSGNLLAAPPANAVPSDTAHVAPRHFDLVNASFDSVTALAIAPADQDAFREIAIGQPLHGGPTSMTFDVPAGGCLRDLRVTFRDGRTRMFPHLDVCRSSGLRLKPQAIDRMIGPAQG